MLDIGTAISLSKPLMEFGQEMAEVFKKARKSNVETCCFTWISSH